ncbi:unnamed protein product [Echinostoma caproni]|uniref:Uncharacterized protein n=1 Tax=Echinostoma caproni TaxID=27848 RepID=A0A183ADB5_9TREM|nr:unnamed protein product [Echinostoma caproni]
MGVLASPASSPPTILDSVRPVDIYPVREPKPIQPTIIVPPDDRSKQYGPLGKPPIKPPHKSSAPARLNRTGRPGYAEMYMGRCRRQSENDAAASSKPTYTLTTIALPPESSSCSDIAESSRDSMCTYPPMIADRVSPVHMKIPSIRSVSGPPATKREYRERFSVTPVVNTTKLNEFTRVTSEPRRVVPVVTQQEVHIPSAFNAFRLTCPPSASEKDKLAAMTRLTELNYETSLTATDPSLSVPVSQPLPDQPDYEGMDAELSERLRLQQQRQVCSTKVLL